VSIRINPKKSLSKDFEKIPWTEFGYYLNERPSFTFDPLFHAGTYYVQEASSMFVEQALKKTIDLSQPLRVLDLCAAPGGKSTHLLSLLNEESLLVTNEVIRSRATILAENICKWGNINAVVTNNDPEDFEKLNGFFDVILIDAPCSGEGLFRKDAEAMNEWSEENVNLCSLRQQRIVEQVWHSLKENGILIYSTCTYNRKENIENMLGVGSKWKAESLKLEVEKSWGIEEINQDSFYGYQFYPHKVKGEGFFISVLRKKSPEDEIQTHSRKSFDYTSKKIIEQLSSWMKNPNDVEFVSNNDLILAIPKNYKDEIELLSKNLRVIQKGTAIGTAKHDKLIPEHDFALSNEINLENFQSIELNYDEAIAYLRRDSLNLSSHKKGFILLKYQNTPIGWVNHLGNRTNNLYPMNWRIRK
jgi:16S rRNA C967 or C1407 C5-methylase (RsmB/RsmF family)/NOL1/NOP2/fmu family ribosome biogenesis protein